MRNVSPRQLKSAMSPNNLPAFTDPVINGATPAVDGITVFPLTEYATRGAAGNFARLVCAPSPVRVDLQTDSLHSLCLSPTLSMKLTAFSPLPLLAE